MALRRISFNIQAKTTLALSWLTESYIVNAVSSALRQGGFIVNNITATDTINSYNIIADLQAEDYIDNEILRQYAQQLVSTFQTTTNYGLYSTNPYPLFSSVVVYLMPNQKTNISIKDAQQAGSLLNTVGLDTESLSLGLGISTPVVIGAAFLLLFLYLKK